MKIGRKEIGLDKPVYFIADIASNHNGDFEQAEDLIRAAAECGADAVKFQNFKAKTLISDYGFEQLGGKSHQSTWKEGVYNTYERYETPIAWTPNLQRIANDAGIDYLTTPYDISILPDLAPYSCAWKLGSGDITYEQMVKAMCTYDKPLIISTGASTVADVSRVLTWTRFKSNIVLMQCNTNYTNDPDNLNYINLKVLATWWGGGVIGFSDHTPGHSAVLGAVSLAARVIEKHFTLDNFQEGPDHAFSMTPAEWSTMVVAVRDLESALGDGVKKIEDNERETVVLQRRAIRVCKDMHAGEIVTESDLVCLRPAPDGSIPPYLMGKAVGRKVTQDIVAGDYLREQWLK